MPSSWVVLVGVPLVWTTRLNWYGHNYNLTYTVVPVWLPGLLPRPTPYNPSLHPTFTLQILHACIASLDQYVHAWTTFASGL